MSMSLIIVADVVAHVSPYELSQTARSGSRHWRRMLLMLISVKKERPDGVFK